MESRRKQKTQWVYSRPPAELTLNTEHNNQQSIDWIQFGLRTVNSLNNITGTRLTSSHNLLRRSRDLPVVTGRFHLPFGRDKLRSSVLWWISRLGRVCRGLVEGVFPAPTFHDALPTYPRLDGGETAIIPSEDAEGTLTLVIE